MVNIDKKMENTELPEPDHCRAKSFDRSKKIAASRTAPELSEIGVFHLLSILTIILTMVYNMSKGGHMIEVSISEFKAKCLALLEQVRKTREPIRVTRHGKPRRRSRSSNAGVDRSKWIGSLKGTVEILGDIISPATDKDEWEAERD